jgi:sorbitol/mannitol transport system permease protein
VLTLILSFVNWNVRIPSIPIQFNGLDNYVFLFTSGEFYQVLRNTAVITVGGLAGSLVAAFLLALAFNRTFPGITPITSLLIIPYFVMEPVIGIVWKTLILSPSLGLNSALSRLLGIRAIDFFDSDHALGTVTFLVIWEWSPFLFLILLAGLKSLPDEIMEAAKVDGAGPLRRVLSLVIPLMRPYFKVAAVFGLINILKVFGIIFVTTAGGPGIASTNLPYYIYQTGFFNWEAGRSAAISVVTVILTLIVINIYFHFQGDVRKR